MQPVKITVTDHVGREVNPYSPYDPIHEPNSDLSRFDYFAKHNVAYPCPELANTKPCEMVEAELVWQWQNPYTPDKRWEDEPDDANHNHSISHGYNTRQIWRLVKEEKADTTPYELIANERRRKSEKYGWDDKAIIERIEDYGQGECAEAAACYCMPNLAHEYFPWDLSYFKPTMDMPTTETRIKELVKAGAFIVDEITRLQALTPPTLK